MHKLACLARLDLIRSLIEQQPVKLNLRARLAMAFQMMTTCLMTAKIQPLWRTLTITIGSANWIYSLVG